MDDKYGTGLTFCQAALDQSSFEAENFDISVGIYHYPCYNLTDKFHPGTKLNNPIK
jgi:hypothetical protein